MAGVKDNPVYSSFAEFAKICLDKQQSPYFKRGKSGEIHEFFFRIKQSHPKEFKDYLFDTNNSGPYCEELDQDLQSLMEAGLLYSMAQHFEPHLFSRGITHYCDDESSEIGQMFYDEFSCDQRGSLGKFTEFKDREQIV